MPALYTLRQPTHNSLMSTVGPGWTPADFRELAQERHASRVAQGIGQGGFLSDAAAKVAQYAGVAAKGAVKSVRIESQITPSYTYRPTPEGTVAKPGVTDWLMRTLIRPMIVVETPAGPQVYAPYGRPQWSAFWPLLIAGAVGAAVVGGLAFKGLTKK